MSEDGKNSALFLMILDVAVVRRIGRNQVNKRMTAAEILLIQANTSPILL